jgi:hypothetical protein
VRAGNTLPIFLFMAGLFVVLEGPLGQPTTLGFAVIFAGLCLAARPTEGAPKAESELPNEDNTPPPARPMRRSIYAERLHGSANRSHPDHGPFDR